MQHSVYDTQSLKPDTIGAEKQRARDLIERGMGGVVARDAKAALQADIDATPPRSARILR